LVHFIAFQTAIETKGSMAACQTILCNNQMKLKLTFLSK
jgi:hypothetical protein